MRHRVRRERPHTEIGESSHSLRIVITRDVVGRDRKGGTNAALAFESGHLQRTGRTPHSRVLRIGRVDVMREKKDGSHLSGRRVLQHHVTG